MKVQGTKTKREAVFSHTGRLFLVALVFFIALPFQTAQGVCRQRPCDGDTIEAPATDGFTGKVIAGMVVVKNYFFDGLTALTKTTNSAGSTLIASKEVDLKHAEALTGAKIDAMAVTADLAIQADIAAATVVSPQEEGLVCHHLGATQAVDSMNRFAELTRDYIMTGVILSGKKRGNGPRYSADNKKRICGEGNPGDPVTGSSRVGWPPACVAKEPPADQNPTMAVFEDSGHNVATLDPEQAVLMVPQMIDETIETPTGTINVKYPWARPGNYLQQLWIAALNVCENGRGAYPQIPYGKELVTSKGIRDTAMASSCLVPQTSHFEPCANDMAYISRPDCGDPVFAPYCEIVKPLCAAAAAQGVNLPPQFQNCENGLSAYETEKILKLICTGPGFALALTKEGGTPSDLQEIASLCLKRDNIWHQRLARKKSNLRQGFDGMITVRNKCWGDIKS